MQDNVYGQLSLTLPIGALPGDAKIRIGSEVPTCMQSVYSAVILFFPVGSNTGIGAPAIRYWGVRKALVATNAVVDQGWAIWDGNTVCFWFVTSDSSSNNTAGTVVSSENIGNLYESGGSGGTISNSFVTLGKRDSVGTAGVPSVITTYGQLTIDLNDAVALAGAVPDWLVKDDGASAGVSALRGMRGTPGVYDAAAAGGVAQSNGAEVAIPTASWTSEPAITARNGRIYLMVLNVGLLPSAATTSIVSLRVRKGAASTAGTMLGRWEPIVAPFTTFATAHTLIGYFKNSSGADVTTTLSVTNQRQGGAATVGLFGSTVASGGEILSLQCFDAGSIDDQTLDSHLASV